MAVRGTGSPTRVAPLTCVVLAMLLAAACGRQSAPPPPAPVPVNVVAVAVGSVPLDLKYSARTRGEREVEVHARVSGILLKRYYREGQQVAANDLLFRIDPAPFAAEVSRLRGLEAMEQARLVEATAQHERILALAAKGIVSKRDRDAAVAAFATARAAADAARAALRQAELNLSYTDVRAPIAGTTGRESRSEGSLVEAGDDSSLLTTIVQSDRLLVDFSLPEHEAVMVRDAMARGPVAVRLATGSAGELAETARMVFIDARIDADTGTVPAQAALDNRQGRVAPGQFVFARIEGQSSAPGIHVPARAVLNSADGTLVWTLDKDDKAQPRPIRVGHATGNLVEVAEGLGAGDRVIVDGILKVQPGTVVKPNRIDINDPPGGPPAAPAAKAVADDATGQAAPAGQQE